MRILLVTLFSALLFSSCSYTNRDLAKKAVTDEENAKTWQMISAIVTQSFEPLRNIVTPDISEQAFVKGVHQLHEQLPGEPVGLEPFQKSSIAASGDISTSAIRYEAKMADGQIRLLNIFFRGSEGEKKIYSFHFQDLATVEKLSQFDWDKGPVAYLFLTLSMIATAISIFAFTAALYLRPKHWWVWALVNIFGVGLFEICWANEQVRISLFQVIMFSGQISKMGLEYSPWWVGFSIPVGAIVFFGRYGREIVRKYQGQDTVV